MLAYNTLSSYVVQTQFLNYFLFYANDPVVAFATLSILLSCKTRIIKVSFVVGWRSLNYVFLPFLLRLEAYALTKSQLLSWDEGKLTDLEFTRRWRSERPNGNRDLGIGGRRYSSRIKVVRMAAI